MTGDTHYLEDLAVQLLTFLALQKLTQDELLHKLYETFIFPPEIDAAALVDSTLAKLRQIGLVAAAYENL